MRKLPSCILAFVVAWGTVAAFADEPYWGAGSHLPWFGYGYSGSLYGLGYLPVPPYFAVHPPVVYSHPVARPYGGSPYAARPRQDAITEGRPTWIVNPFVVAGSNSLPQAVGASTASPRIITNPFFKPSASPQESIPSPQASQEIGTPKTDSRPPEKASP